MKSILWSTLFMKKVSADLALARKFFEGKRGSLEE